MSVDGYDQSSYNNNESRSSGGVPTIERPLAMGLRKPPSRLLTEDEIKQLKDDIRAIGADELRVLYGQN